MTSESDTIVDLGEVRLQLRDREDILGVVETFVFDAYSSHLIRKGDCVIDLGAGIGDFAVRASRLSGPDGIVLAVEPSPSDFSVLSRNLSSNQCTNVTALNVGVGSSTRQVESTFKGQALSFETRTLNDLLGERHFPSPNFVKIDIEGMESEVIESSKSVLNRARVLAIEFHGTQSKTTRALDIDGFRAEPLSRGNVWLHTLVFVLRHPVVSARLYRALRRAIGRSPFGRLIRGPEITRGDGLRVVLFKRV